VVFFAFLDDDAKLDEAKRIGVVVPDSSCLFVVAFVAVAINRARHCDGLAVQMDSC
jgi:hypothetical protein